MKYNKYIYLPQNWVQSTLYNSKQILHIRLLMSCNSINTKSHKMHLKVQASPLLKNIIGHIQFNANDIIKKPEKDKTIRKGIRHLEKYKQWSTHKQVQNKVVANNDHMSHRQFISVILIEAKIQIAFLPFILY